MALPVPVTFVKKETLIKLLREEHRAVVQTEASIPANSAVNQNIATILGADASQYDLSTIEIHTKVLDTDAGSSTLNFYVDASAVVTSGFKKTGEVTVQNTTAGALTVITRIVVSKKTT